MIRYIALFLLLSTSQAGLAAVSDGDFSDLKKELMSLMNRVEALESENRELRESVTSTTKTTDKLAKAQGAARWAESVKISGDLRYRYENIDAERSDTRERNRVRARVAVTARPSDNLEIGIGLASGSDDPVSTNQTLGNGGSTKDINLDLAYFKWQAQPGLNLIGGKMKNVFFKPGGSGLLWDGDYRPEGLAITFDKGNFFIDSGIHFLESDTKKDNHRISYGIQSGFKGAVGDSKFVTGIGYFEHGTQGREVFFGDPDDFFGNTYTCANPAALAGCVYNNDYEELELFAQITTSVGDLPLSLFADLVQNQDASDLDTAWAVGLKLGKASNTNTWEVAYTYQDIEADAVLGLITDSDFSGGGTDSKGHMIKGAWAVNKNWKIGFTYFNNERNMDLGTPEDYQRVMIDTAYKF